MVLSRIVKSLSPTHLPSNARKQSNKKASRIIEYCTTIDTLMLEQLVSHVVSLFDEWQNVW